MSRNKKAKNFKQYDESWAKDPYPARPYYVLDSGCGPTAIADLIVTNPKYAKKTPKNTAKWLAERGYATYGDGTMWSGMTACLKAYGFRATQHDNMSSFWKEMKKSERMAIISFRGGSKSGITWTLGGHFLACSGMKIKNGQHYLYMLDPGPRNHDGWYIYEKHMKGLIAQLWTCYLPNQEKKKTTKKKVETVTKKPKKKPMNELVTHAKKRAKEKHKYKVGGWSWKTGLECHAFTAKVYKECGYTDVYNRIKKKGFYKKPQAGKYLGKYLQCSTPSGLKAKDLKPGDIVIRKNGKSLPGYHTAIYVGDGKVAEAVKGGTRIGKLTKKFIMAFRIPEPFTATYEVIIKRALRKSFSSKTENLKTLEPGTKFKCNYKRNGWIHAYKIYNPKTKKWDACNGWIGLKSKGKNTCKKVK